MAYVPLGFDEFAPYSNFYGLEDSADDRPKRGKVIDTPN